MGTTIDAGDDRAPVADDPLGPVLAPQHDLVALADAGVAPAGREHARGARDLGVACAVAPDSRRRRRESRRDASRGRGRGRRACHGRTWLNYDRSASVTTSKLPPAFVIGAHYDTFLQRALRRFFERATLETEPVPSPSSDGRLAIEPTGRSGGARGPLVRQPLRAARAGAPAVHRRRKCASRARSAACSRRATAPFSTPQLMVERAGLFRGAIEDRYVGRVLRRHAVLAAGRWRPVRACRRGARDSARGGALELREPADLDRRAAARGRRGSGGSVSGGRARLAALHGRADVDQELLPPRRRPAHACFWWRATAVCSTSSTSTRWGGRVHRRIGADRRRCAQRLRRARGGDAVGPPRRASC